MMPLSEQFISAAKVFCFCPEMKSEWRTAILEMVRAQTQMTVDGTVTTLYGCYSFTEI